MPKNKVVEKMVQKQYAFMTEPGMAWEDGDLERLALELLAIMEERTYEEIGQDGNDVVACEDDLVEAFQLARAAREKGKKHG